MKFIAGHVEGVGQGGLVPGDVIRSETGTFINNKSRLRVRLIFDNTTFHLIHNYPIFTGSGDTTDANFNNDGNVFIAGRILLRYFDTTTDFDKACLATSGVDCTKLELVTWRHDFYIVKNWGLENRVP